MGRILFHRNVLGLGEGPCGEKECWSVVVQHKFHVKTESGTQVASRGPTWRIATPLV